MRPPSWLITVGFADGRRRACRQGNPGFDAYHQLDFHGDGANGKTTFIELIAWVFGDYARKIPTEMLMSHKRVLRAMVFRKRLPEPKAPSSMAFAWLCFRRNYAGPATLAWMSTTPP
jgi:hypothetical protein